ncbi:MAG: ABC transporter permease [Candidatus Bathyarchaeota archaeon]|nr:ABC transporter permease [Candidatus Bathyarchaeota archaeon]
MRPLVLYVTKRVIAYVLTIFLASTVCFFLFRLIPGNPIGAYISMLMAQQSYLPGAEEARKVILEYKRVFGLDGDLFTQYVNFLKEIILNQNLGPSFINFPKPAQVLIAQYLPWTIGLLGFSAVIAWVLGNILGALVGWKKDSNWGKPIFYLALGLSQIPFYFVAIVLILVFGYMLAVLPTRGAYAPWLVPDLSFEFITSLMLYALLPSLSFVLTSVAGWIISMRSMIITILGEDYLLFAEAKGLKRSRIFMRYALRNALLPQATGFAMSLGFIFSGSFVIENMFSYPGIGYLFGVAIGQLDYNTVQGILLISIFAVTTANLLMDLLYPLIDPRIRYQR